MQQCSHFAAGRARSKRTSKMNQRTRIKELFASGTLFNNFNIQYNKLPDLRTGSLLKLISEVRAYKS